MELVHGFVPYKATVAWSKNLNFVVVVVYSLIRCIVSEFFNILVFLILLLNI